MKLNDLVEIAAPDARSAPDLAASVLREAILRGLLPEGQALRQDVLAAELGLSKIPVREALRQLEAEGLVIFYPNRGAVVAGLSAAEAQEIAEMRVALETLALRLALPKLPQAVLRRADALLDELDEERDVSRWSALNWAFHALLYQPAERPQLLATIRGLHMSVDRYMRIVLAALQHQSRSQEEHRALLAACRSRDAALATAIVTRHIETAGTMLVEHLNAHAARQSRPWPGGGSGRRPGSNRLKKGADQ